jgi:hypothetical protein
MMTYQVERDQRGICQPLRKGEDAQAAAERVAMRQAKEMDEEFSAIREMLCRQHLAIKRLEDEADTLGGEIAELRKPWISRALTKIRDFFKT